MVFLGLMFVVLIASGVASIVSGRRETRKLLEEFAREDKQRDAWG
jgi:hypothetical protein